MKHIHTLYFILIAPNKTIKLMSYKTKYIRTLYFSLITPNKK